MKKFIKKILILAFVSISLSTVMPVLYTAPQTANATEFSPTYIPRPDNLPGPETTEQTTIGTRQLLTERILPRFAIGLIGMTGGFALLMIVIGGVRYLTAYGNDEAAGKGKTQIIYGIVGMIVALLAYTIVTVITNLNIENQDVVPIETQAAKTNQ
ncbi:pilin [Candidatus Gracilibacteria bacterium]|jgi:hypothetical protein|nr:pilin [Candidatus Gracilibacteria bacterium]